MLWMRSPRKIPRCCSCRHRPDPRRPGARQVLDRGRVDSRSTEETDTGYKRLYLWKIAWRMFVDHPILGVGPGNYQYNNFFYEDEKEKARGTTSGDASRIRCTSPSCPNTASSDGVVHRIVSEGRLLPPQGSVLPRWRARTSPRNGDRFRYLQQMLAAMDSCIVTFLVTGAFIAVLYYPHLWVLTAFTVVAVRMIEGCCQQCRAPAAVTRAPAPPVVMRCRPLRLR